MDFQIIVKIILEGSIMTIAGIAIFGFIKEYIIKKHKKIEDEYKHVLEKREEKKNWRF